MRPWWMGSVALLGLLAAGCGDPKPTLAPVCGHIYFHGQPLNGGAVVFTPDPEHGGRGPLAFSRIAEDGGYVLSTGLKTGAAPGWHRVTFKALPSAPAASSADNRLPAHYSDPEQSGQTCEVKAAQANVIDFHLE